MPNQSKKTAEGVMVGQPTIKSRKDAEYLADLVVRRGRATKNRFGPSGTEVPLSNGCYRLERIEPPRTRKRS